MTGLHQRTRQFVIWRKRRDSDFLLSDSCSPADSFSHGLLGTRLTANDLRWLKENLVVAFGHEFRTPLTVIKGYLELLIREEGRIGNAQRLDIYRVMQESVGVLCSLVETAVSAADLTLKEHVFTPAPVDLQSAVMEAAARYLEPRSEPTRGGIRVQVEAGCVRGVVMGSHSHLREMVTQMIELMGAALPSGNEAMLRIELREDYRQVLIRFFLESDSDPLVKPLVRKEDLNGLGLYFVRKVVERHEGQLSLSEWDGCGAVVTVSIPKGGMCGVSAEEGLGGR